jgi:cell wall-associated NlpC family hydrolase
MRLRVLVLAVLVALPAPVAAAQTAAPAGPAAAPPAAPAPAASGTVRDAPVALDRAQVRALQRRIGQRVDGALGPRTRAALRRAERRRGLPVDGRPDAVLLAALGLPLPAAAPAPAAAPTPPAATAASGDPVAAALSVVGRPYGAGAAGPAAFDCSGLVQWAFARAGVRLPRSSFAQHAAARPVARDAIRRGDLVFFSTAGPGPSDVAIATGPTTVVSATTAGVREHPISGPYWGEHFVGAGRVGAA